MVPSAAPVLAPLSMIAWPWYVLIGTSITLGVGIAASLTHAAPVRHAADVTGAAA